ncbi:MAG: hypothetical protein GY798_16190, partial [Hyphomicrobiales bacterium]|nr:hypothetical protein [Hyphomicrobiales bacterium]
MARRTTAKAETVDRNSLALALSGGGFRATLFHCGALMRLNELGLLTQATRISSVSGGSIANGALAVAWPGLSNRNGVIGNLRSKVIAPLRTFCQRSLDTTAVGLGTILRGKSIGDVLADIYDEMYKGATLQDLPDSPQFVFNAANLQTGRLVRMQKVRLADYTIGEIVRPKIRVAVAVAASSAFPPVLSPVDIDVDPAAWQKRKGAVHHGKPAFSRTLSLTDGGVYDNLGLETVDDFNPVIVSDAGAPFGTDESTGALWPQQALRALDIATDQSRGLRKRLLFAECAASGRVPVYAGIDGNPKVYPAAQTLKVNRKLTARLAG